MMGRILMVGGVLAGGGHHQAAFLGGDPSQTSGAVLILQPGDRGELWNPARCRTNPMRASPAGKEM